MQVSPSGRDVTVIIETFLHSASQCIRQDPPDWTVSAQQTVTVALPAASTSGPGSPTSLDVWRSCTGWRYPADDDSYMLKQAPVPVSESGHVTLVADVNCYYTLTTRKVALSLSSLSLSLSLTHTHIHTHTHSLTHSLDHTEGCRETEARDSESARPSPGILPAALH